jgi:hypothetical protein
MWSLTLAVEVGGEPCRFYPQVSVNGPGSFPGGTLFLELIDERGYIRHLERRELRPDTLGTQVRLAPFHAPRGADPEAVVGWRWELAVASGGVELIRWRRYLAAPDRLTAEAELDLSDSPASLAPKVEDEGIGPESAWDRRDSERLLAELGADGILAPREQAAILDERTATGRTVERILIEAGVLTECEVLGRWAKLTGSEFVDLAHFPVDPDAAATIPDVVVRRHGAIGIGFCRGLLTVAMSDPQRTSLELADLYACTGSPIYIVAATRAQVLAALDARSFDLGPASSCRGRDVQ